LADVNLHPWTEIERQAASEHRPDRVDAQRLAMLHIQELVRSLFTEEERERGIPRCVKDIGERFSIEEDLVRRVVRGVLHRNDVTHEGADPDPVAVPNDVAAMKELCLRFETGEDVPAAATPEPSEPGPWHAVIDNCAPTRTTSAVPSVPAPAPLAPHAPVTSGPPRATTDAGARFVIEFVAVILALLLFAAILVVWMLATRTRQQVGQEEPPIRTAPSEFRPVSDERLAVPRPAAANLLTPRTPETPDANTRTHPEAARQRSVGPCRTRHRGDELDKVTDLADSVRNRLIANGLAKDCGEDLEGLSFHDLDERLDALQVRDGKK